MDISYRRVIGTVLLIVVLRTLATAILGSPRGVPPITASTTTSTSAPSALATLSGNGLTAPKGIVQVGAQVWVANNATSTLSRFNADGTAAGHALSGNGLNSPYGITVVGSQVWVANAGTSTLSRFNADGTAAGSPLAGNGLSTPKGLVVVGTQVWVANAGTSTLSRFNPDGTAAGSPLAGAGLDGPRGGAVVGAQVWIPNYNTSTLSLFTATGTATGSLLTGNGLNGPEAAAVIGGTQVWVPNYSGNSVSLFNLDGTAAGNPLTGNGLTQPHGIAAVGANQVWVVNAGTSTISRWQLSPTSPTATSTATNTPVPSTSTPTTTPVPPTNTPTRTGTATATATSMATNTPAATSTPLPPTPSGGHAIKTVFLIVMENHNWSSIKGSPSAPYLNTTLLPMASHAEQYYNPPGNHPSLTNYLWLEAGTNFGIADDNPPISHTLRTTTHLVTLLSTAGISWKAYEENISGTNCPLTDNYPYVVSHDPFVYFDDVTNVQSVTSTTCLAHVRPYTQLATDLATDTVARYNVITPDKCDDMHDPCTPISDTVKQGDTWLQNTVPAILSSQAYKDGGALFITWDEGEDGTDGPIGMIALSPAARGGGYSNSIHYTHSSTLRTLEEIFGVSPLLGDAANATDLRDLFNTFP